MYILVAWENVLIKGSISSFAHMFSELFQTLTTILYGTLFHEISDTKCPLPTENTCFSSEELENSFPFWARYSGTCLSKYFPPQWPSAGLFTGKHAGWVCMQSTNMPARSRSDALVPVSQLGWSDFSSKSQLILSSYRFSPLLIFTGTFYSLSYKVRGHTWSP